MVCNGYPRKKCYLHNNQSRKPKKTRLGILKEQPLTTAHIELDRLLHPRGDHICKK